MDLTKICDIYKLHNAVVISRPDVEGVMMSLAYKVFDESIKCEEIEELILDILGPLDIEGVNISVTKSL